MDKIYVVLELYDKLKAGEGVSLKETCEKYKISMPTFQRYIACLRCHVTTRLGREIVYSRKENNYRLAAKSFLK